MRALVLCRSKVGLLILAVEKDGLKRVLFIEEVINHPNSAGFPYSLCRITHFADSASTGNSLAGLGMERKEEERFLVLLGRQELLRTADEGAGFDDRQHGNAREWRMRHCRMDVKFDSLQRDCFLTLRSDLAPQNVSLSELF